MHNCTPAPALPPPPLQLGPTPAPPRPHLMGRSAMRCRPLAVTLKVILPSIQRPSVARYMALRKANHRIELATWWEGGREGRGGSV